MASGDTYAKTERSASIALRTRQMLSRSDASVAVSACLSGSEPGASARLGEGARQMMLDVKSQGNFSHTNVFVKCTNVGIKLCCKSHRW